MLRKRTAGPPSTHRADRVHLQREDAARREVVENVGGRHAVDPRPDRGADGFDAERVPLAQAEGLAGGVLAGHVWSQPRRASS